MIMSFLFLLLLLFVDFAMSNEIKDNEDVHPEIKSEHEQPHEEIVEAEEPIKTITSTEETQVAEVKVEENLVEREQQEDDDDDNDDEESQATTSNHDVEIEPSVLTDDIKNEAPSIPIPPPDVIIEKEDEPLSAPASEENVEEKPTAEEITLTPISAQSEEQLQVTNSHQHPLLQSITDKSNREASSIILNTVTKRIFVLIFLIGFFTFLISFS